MQGFRIQSTAHSYSLFKHLTQSLYTMMTQLNMQELMQPQAT